MTPRNIKIGVTMLVLGLAFGGLFWSTLREGTEYFKNLDEVVNDQPQWHDKQLQLHGYVVPGSIYRSKTNALEWRFKVQNNPAKGGSGEPGGTVNASYVGIVPDTFKDEAEVVLKGKLSPDGFHVDPNGVMAKCPSKYEAKSGV
ncbi:MAG TPA: cytochrome c maturation protein CcmE [Vicinamibacterales bacterium]|nr:cytochrome c maturation protein CcmE [Vicinamibacterales bacterium]